MKSLLPYRILSFILLPVAALLGIMVLLLLPASLANTMLLIPAFLFASVVIYVIASFIFLQKGIDQKQVCKHSLQDWIKVNAIVAVVFCVWFLFVSVAGLSNAQLLNDAVKQGLAQQQNNMVISEAMLMKFVKGMLYFFLIFSSLLLGHIFFTFRMMKAYGQMFAKK